MANPTRGEDLRRDLAGRLGIPADDLRRVPVASVTTALDYIRNLEDKVSVLERDELTGVYRRGPGELKLQIELARMGRNQRQALVVAFVDVDGLKQANDTQGHEEGDRRIRTVGGELSAQLRPYDVVFRYGGDEFVLVMPDITVADAERRLKSMATKLRGQNSPVSIGVAAARTGDSVSTALARADAQMYANRAVARRQTSAVLT